MTLSNPEYLSISKPTGGKIVGYLRVSSITQNTERQLEGIPLDRVFTEYASGKDTNRPQLQAMLDYVREGDTLVVHSLDRLARNLADLRRMVTDLTSRGVRVEFRKESLVFDGKETALSGFLLNMLGGVAEFERALSRERQLEGVAIAKCCTTCGKPRVEHLTGMHKFKSRYMGRVSAIRASNGKLDILERLYADGAGVSVMAHEAGVSRQTVYSWLKSNGKAPNARYKPAEALVGNAHTRDAVRSYLVAMRALGRTKINTSEVADALALPVAEVDCIVSFLGKKGMEMLETTQRSDSNLLCAAD